MLELFILEKCPYCIKVTDFLKKTNLNYRTIDISQKEAEESLIKIGGKRQVPFLIDKERNIQMYESSDILEYLKTIS